MNINEFNYHKPKTVKEACELKEKFRDSSFLAGGTFIISLAQRTKNISKNLISLKGVAQLSGISLKRNTLTIGAMSVLDDLASDVLIKEKLPLLPEVLSYISSAQIRNMAAAGGSLCCGLPWVDLPIALLVLGAEIELSSTQKNILMPIADFLQAPKIISKNKLLVNIKIKIPSQKLDYAFVRFSKDTDLDVPLVSVCVAKKENNKNKPEVIFAVNFGNRFTQRLNNVENYFKESKLSLKWGKDLENLISSEMQNLETSEYRRDVLLACLKKAVEKLSRE